jgi:hypothetical protein
MDKDFRVRLEFERTGQIDAWRRLRRHNRQQKTRQAFPQNPEDSTAMQALLSKYPHALREFDRLSKTGCKRYFLRLTTTLMAVGRARVLANNDMAQFLAFILTAKHLTVRAPEDFVPKSRNPERVGRELMHHLFGNFQVSPWIWYGVWNWCDANLLMPCIYQMQGRSLRELPQPPRQLSKRLLHHFQRAPEGCTFFQAYRWAQVRRWGGNMAHFMSLWRELGYTASEEEPFWETVVQYVVRHKPVAAKQMELIAAYLRHARFGIHENYTWQDALPAQPANPHFKFHHLTMEELIERSKAHHEECSRLYASRSLQWEKRLPHVAFGYTSIDRDLSWEAVELTSAQQLHLESRKMNHCVKTYVSRCLGGYAAIFSIRRNGKPMATIEVNPKTLKITQVQGPCNSPLVGETKWAFDLWRACAGVA